MQGYPLVPLLLVGWVGDGRWCSGGGGEAAPPQSEREKEQGKRSEGEGLLERERDSKDIKKIMSRLIRNKGKRCGSHEKKQYKLYTYSFASRTSVNANYVSRSPNEANE